MILNEAQSIMLQVSFEGVKSAYKLNDIRIDIRADVQFDYHSYSFDGQVFSYGQYPDASMIEAFVDRMKKMVLDKMEKAAEQS